MNLFDWIFDCNHRYFSYASGNFDIKFSTKDVTFIIRPKFCLDCKEVLWEQIKGKDQANGSRT